MGYEGSASGGIKYDFGIILLIITSLLMIIFTFIRREENEIIAVSVGISNKGNLDSKNDNSVSLVLLKSRKAKMLS